MSDFKPLEYKDFQEFLAKTGMTPEAGRDFLLAECKKRGLL